MIRLQTLYKATIELRAEEELLSQVGFYVYVGPRLICGFTCYAKATRNQLFNEKFSLL